MWPYRSGTALNTFCIGHAQYPQIHTTQFEKNWEYVHALAQAASDALEPVFFHSIA